MYEQSFLGECHLLVFEIAKQKEYVMENSDLQNFCEQLFALNKKKGMAAGEEDHGNATTSCGQRSGQCWELWTIHCAGKRRTHIETPLPRRREHEGIALRITS